MLDQRGSFALGSAPPARRGVVLVRTLFLVFGAALLAAATSHAQVVSARVVEFVASPDHARLLPDGRPVLSAYELELYAAGADVPFHRASLGKPVPGASQVVQFDFSPLVPGWPLPGGAYQARVAATGPLGRSVSGASNTFTLDGPGCSPIVSPTTVTLPADGGSAAIDITAMSACQWIAASGDPWVTPSPARGSGTASVGLAVAANPGSTSRIATVLVAGREITVVQSGPITEETCTYRLRPAQLTLEASGLTMPVSLRTDAGCAWTAASPVRWLRADVDGGSGSAVVGVLARTHTGKYPRIESVTIAGRAVTVTQLGICAPVLAPTSLTFGADGGTATVAVTVPDGCNWGASSSRAWASASPTSGAGTGIVTVAVPPNRRSSGRRAIVDVGGRSLEVFQGARPASGTPDAETFTYALHLDETTGIANGVLLLVNPAPRDVTASVSAMGRAATTDPATVTIRALSEVELSLRDLATGIAPGQSIIVAASGPLAVVGSTFPLVGEGAIPAGQLVAVAQEATAPLAPDSDAPAARWVVAGVDGGSPGLGPAWLLVSNPAREPVVVDVTLLPEAGGLAPRTRSVTLAGAATMRRDLVELFPEAYGQRFGVLVATRDAAAGVVVSAAVRQASCIDEPCGGDVVLPGVPMREGERRP